MPRFITVIDHTLTIQSLFTIHHSSLAGISTSPSLLSNSFSFCPASAIRWPFLTDLHNLASKLFFFNTFCWSDLNCGFHCSTLPSWFPVAQLLSACISKLPRQVQKYPQNKHRAEQMYLCVFVYLLQSINEPKHTLKAEH